VVSENQKLTKTAMTPNRKTFMKRSLRRNESEISRRKSIEL
jgi:hypothetical protein